jgi:hypothetical protein
MWLTERMFVDQAMPLGVTHPTARERFLRLIQGGLLEGMSRDAYAGGQTGRLKVGPLGGVPVMSKLVQVSLLEPVLRDDLVLVPIRWEATGLMGGLFPVLDANLILDTGDQDHPVLRITGVYRPPLDGLGGELDQLVLRRVAAATLKSLLRDIAGRLASEIAGTTSHDPSVRQCPDRDTPT